MDSNGDAKKTAMGTKMVGKEGLSGQDDKKLPASNLKQEVRKI